MGKMSAYYKVRTRQLEAEVEALRLRAESAEVTIRELEGMPLHEAVGREKEETAFHKARADAFEESVVERLEERDAAEERCTKLEGLEDEVAHLRACRTNAENENGELRDALEFIREERPCYNCDNGGDPSSALRVWCVECGGKRTEYPSAKECRDAANRALSKEIDR